ATARACSTRPPAPESAGSAAGSVRWEWSTSFGAEGGGAGGIDVVQPVQGRIDSPGERFVDPFDLGDLLHSRRLQARQAAEVAQQVGPPPRPAPGDVLQPAGAARLLQG